MCRARGRPGSAARSGHTDDAVYVNEPDGFRDPFAFRMMLAHGENPVARARRRRARRRAALGRRARRRPARRAPSATGSPATLYERTPLDDRRAARASGGAGRPGSRLVAAARRARGSREPGASRVVVKSVQSALALEWIADRFQPRVLVVERNPFNVLASWSELGYVRNPRETAALIAAYAPRPLGHRAAGRRTRRTSRSRRSCSAC